MLSVMLMCCWVWICKYPFFIWWFFEEGEFGREGVGVWQYSRGHHDIFNEYNIRL